MSTRRPPFLVLSVLSCAAVAAFGCGGDGSGSGGLNVLNGDNTGGTARVMTITAVDSEGVEDANLVYSDDLLADCEANWEPSGTLCDDDRNVPATRDSATESWRVDSDVGATWDAFDGNDGPVTGQLIIDACATGCSTIQFSEARVFQMFSDGKTTHVRFYVHPGRDGTVPAWDDAGWRALGAERAVGPGRHDTTDGSLVTAPTRIVFGEVAETRYLRIEARNDGSYGDENYIELRSVKLF
ncbi:MAG: hypothetical protein KC593_11785 [Myxococcales bacterium]|nr:hypothetical protein [Myxococcales bacterium]